VADAVIEASFRVDFRPERASERATRITRVILTPALTTL
jgi:hypothetical protein